MLPSFTNTYIFWHCYYDECVNTSRSDRRNDDDKADDDVPLIEEKYPTNDELPDSILYSALVVRHDCQDGDVHDDQFDGTSNMSCQRQEMRRL